MRRFLALASLLTLSAACSAGAQGGDDRSSRSGSGERDFQIGTFQAIDLAGAYNVIVTVGGEPSARAEGEQAGLDELEVRVEDGVLRIGARRNGALNWRGRGPVTVHVSAPTLRSASIRGSGDMRIDRVRSEAFAAAVSGSGDLDIAALQARRASFDIAGSGDIRAAGATEEASLSIAGSGNIRLDSLQARRASVSIMGSGDISLRATDAVDGSIMGSGDVVVRGTTRCSVSRMGSGDVRCQA